MSPSRPLHPDFHTLLDFKDQPLIDLFMDLRAFILDINPDCNEMLYHTHALTSVFSISDKLSDAYCMIPIYTCLLYTSDAADERSSVDLGGRRIIKKKTINNKKKKHTM